MKRINLTLLITAFIILTPLTVLAEDPGSSESGFSGRLQGGGFYLQTDSQLYSNNTDQVNDELDGPADSTEEVNPLASIFLQYQFKGGTAIYAGNPLEIESDFSLSAGVRQPLFKSTLDVSVAWVPINEVWKNPYQVGSAREETDMNSRGLRVKWEEIAGSHWEGFYYNNLIDIESDEIGDLENDLKREGWTHELGIKYNLLLNQGLILRPELSYSYGDIEGDSNSYHGLDIGVMLMYVQPQWVLTGQVSGFHNQYQKTHPLFDKTRQETGFFTLAQAMRLNLLGVNRLFANFMVGYGLSDANIDFFDSQTIISLASIGINF